MKKILLPAAILFTIFSSGYSQQLSNKLKFDQGQILDISMSVKTVITQQAMGQAIDFTVDANAGHSYRVTNTTDDNTTLHHAVQHVSFLFDGMGQKRKFDSKEEKDLNGQFGKPIKEILEKKYDLIIDPTGKVMMALPETVSLTAGDSRMAIITSMLKDVLDLVQPPQKGSSSFFQVLPDKELIKGTTWTSSSQTATSKSDVAYVISGIGDSTILVDFVENSISQTKAEMMGMETNTTLNNKSSGKIILDKATGIMKEKTIHTESTGTTESASFGSIPVSSKTDTVIKVKPVEKKE